jgi:hypothetical protein
MMTIVYSFLLRISVEILIANRMCVGHKVFHFLYNFCITFFAAINISLVTREMRRETRFTHNSKCSLLLFDFNKKFGMYRQILELAKIRYQIFIRVVACGLTGMEKTIGAFLQLFVVNSPKYVYTVI